MGDSDPLDDLPELQELGDMTDAERKLKAAHELASRYEVAANEARRIRREVLSELVADGRTQGELAKVLGLTRARVGQLLTSGPKPERALLGTGPLTISIGGKPEGPKQTGLTSTVTSEESEKACALITDAADSYGLSVTREVVRPPGHALRLNRPNLIVIGSPRLLPLMSQVLESDRNLGFDCGAQGWYLTERGEIRRSPSDNGEHSDYGYLGRLPRTDSKGTFLYVAGIHAMGTLGAAAYLSDHIDDLYAEARRGRWSVLVECQYDPDTREIRSTERLTQLYIA